MVAVVGHEDAGLLGGLDDRGALRHGDLHAVDGYSRPVLDRPFVFLRGSVDGANANRRQRRLAIAVSGDIRLELAAELLDPAYDRRGAGIAEHADRLARHVLGQVEQQLEVFLLPLPRQDPLQDAGGPRGAFSALRALGAGLVGVEPGQPPDLVDHVGAVVHDDHAGRAEHRALLHHALVVEERRLGLLHVHDRHRGAPRNHGLELPSRGRAAAHVVEDVPHRRAHRHLVVPGPLHVAADRDQLGAGALGVAEAERLVPGGALVDDVRDRGQRLDVVDRGRHPEDARHRREGRLDARVAALALDRVHHRGLFAADVGAGARGGARSRSASRCRRRCRPARRWRTPRRRRAHHLPWLGELAADVDVAALRPDRVRGDGAALDQRVRGPPHDLAVLEGAGLRLVGVAHQVVRLHHFLGHERPLEAGREAGAAAAAETGRLHLLDERLAGHAQRLA